MIHTVRSCSSLFLRQSLMEALLLCVVLLTVGRFHGDAVPVSTVQVRVGDDVTLRCPLLDAFRSSRAAAVPCTLSWYRKTSGRGPQLLLSLKSSNTSALKLGAGVRPDRVSAAADGSLLLLSSQSSDSAVYYCGLSLGHDGKRKKKEVTGQ